MLSQSEYDQAREEGYSAAVMDIAELLELAGIDLCIEGDDLTLTIMEIDGFTAVH